MKKKINQEDQFSFISDKAGKQLISNIIKKKYWNVALLHWRDIKFINIMLILDIKKPTKKKKERKKKKKKSHYLFMASATLSRCI